MNAVLVVLDVLAGFVLWTLVEYAGHRWVMHGERPNPLRREHRRHHQSPTNPSVVGTVRYGAVALAIVATMGWFASLVIGPPAAYLASGFAAGVVAYVVSHQATHRIDQLGRGRLLAPWRDHLEHHEAHPGANFGFTTSLWDRVFRTRA